MVKIIMEHDERVEDILDKAEKLIAEKGYDNTTVSDIIKKVGIAKGTFYHYFESKDELLESIIERTLLEIWNQMDGIADDTEKDTLTKFFLFFNVFPSISDDQKILIRDIHKENGKIQKMFDQKMMIEIVPKFEKIVLQGVNEGIFDTKYPSEAAKVTIVALHALTDVSERFERKMEVERTMMLFDFMARILGDKNSKLKNQILKMGE